MYDMMHSLERKRVQGVSSDDANQQQLAVVAGPVDAPLPRPSLPPEQPDRARRVRFESARAPRAAPDER